MKVFDLGMFHGEVESVRHVDEICFAITRRSARTTVPTHVHSMASFTVLLSGQHHWVNSEGKIRWSLPGIWYYRHPFDPHAHESCPSEIRSLGVQFNVERVAGNSEFDTKQVLDHPTGRVLISEIVENLGAEGADSDHMLLSSFHRLIACFMRYKRLQEDQNLKPWLASARQWLDDHRFKPIHLKACADAIGAHPSHLAREFRSAFGLTVGDYIRDRRLEWSYEQIVQGDRKIADIALAAGFADHAHLSRLFKQRYGRSPSEFRG